MITLEEASVSIQVPGPPGRGWTRRTLLEPLSVSLPERRIAVIGANGSGKSTLLRLFNGLVRATSGRVRVDGLDPARDARRVRQAVGFIFTDPLSQLVMPTPLEDIELSLRRTVRDRHARREAALAMLAARGLAGVAEQSIYDLSGGERQLVALTSVLAVEPVIIVADEPTTLLDLRNRERMRAVFDGLPQQLVVATHDLDVAADAERVLVIDDGRLVHDGPPREAIAVYRELMGR